MGYNYCTLFDSNYLSRAIVMYESLSEHTADFHLYIFAFDDTALKILNALQLPKATIISLEEFEDEELLEIKNTRSQTEYCWTCTPCIILYSIKKFNLDLCTYIDADLFFYSDPKVLIEEMGNDSILLTEHNYAPQNDQTATSGKYCVQFMSFRNDSTGMNALTWWRNACNEWCYQRVEDGKFGDQKYLDDWVERFDKVHVLKNPGGGVAPWNIEKYNLIKEHDEFRIVDKVSEEKWKIIFFHFHAVKFTEEIYSLFNFRLFKHRKLSYSNYIVPDIYKAEIYNPYLFRLLQAGRQLRYFGTIINFHAVEKRFRKIENRIYRIFNDSRVEAID